MLEQQTKDFLYNLHYLPDTLLRQLSNISLKDWESHFPSPEEMSANLSSIKSSYKGSIIFKEISIFNCQIVCGIEDSQETRNRYSLKDDLYDQNVSSESGSLELDLLNEKTSSPILPSSPLTPLNGSPRITEKSMKMLNLSKMTSKNLLKKEKLTQLNYLFHDRKILISDGSVAALLRHLIGEAGLGFGILN